MTRPRNATVALVQSEPAFLDLRASVDLAVSRIEDAATRGAQLVVFGESWLPGYPFWVDVSPGAARWGDAHAKEVHATLRAESPTVDGPEIRRLREVAADRKVVVTIGMHERVDRGRGTGTLYNALLTIDGPDGGSIGVHHRKLVPTHGERLVWGQGDADGLRAIDTPAGRVGGLICWEHWMPLARQALHDSGEQLHVAQWPTVNDAALLASRHYAFEGRCYVLAVGSLAKFGALPEALRPPDADPDAWALRGGSCIFGPDGRAIVEPRYETDETIIAELDLSAIDRESMTLDVSGHYARRDVLRFAVLRSRGDA